MPSPGLVPPPGVGAGTLVGVTLWRLVVAGFAFTGVVAAAATDRNPWPSLSQQASVLAGAVYLGLALYPLATGGRAHEPRSAWLRGAVCLTLLLVAVTYATVLGGNLDGVDSLFEHLLTPVAVLVDFVAVGHNQAGLRWWHPFTWLVFPALYLVYFLIADPGLYRSFLDPDDSGFPGVVATFLVAVLAAGFALYVIGRLRADTTFSAGDAREADQP